jgi:mannosyltransferase OCH1-like enzyme
MSLKTNKKVDINSLKNMIYEKKQERQNEINKKIKDHNAKVRYNNMMNRNFDINPYYKSTIPLNLYTYWHDEILPDFLRSNYDLLVKQHPRFNNELYNEKTAEEFIEDNFNSDVLYAFKKLMPCAYKSDLFRLCILYKTGGIYIDIKYKCLNGFNFMALTEKEYFVKDRQELNVDNPLIYNGLIVSKPGNEILINSINLIVNNVKRNYYGKHPLDPTGPGLLGKFFSTEDVSNMVLNFDCINLDESPEKCYICLNNRNIILTYCDDNYRNEQIKYQKRPRYDILWCQNQIYG